MTKHNAAHLEKNIRELMELGSQFGDAAPFSEMLKIIHRPGWTTPAELQLVQAILESITAQTRGLLVQRHALLAGARAVGAGQVAGV